MLLLKQICSTNRLRIPAYVGTAFSAVGLSSVRAVALVIGKFLVRISAGTSVDVIEASSYKSFPISYSSII
jgi:hypothetical protein